MKQFIKFTAVVCILSLVGCNPKKENNAEKETPVPTVKTEFPMQNFMALFEIPANDVDRAIALYQESIEIEEKIGDVQS